MRRGRPCVTTGVCRMNKEKREMEEQRKTGSEWCGSERVMREDDCADVDGHGERKGSPSGLQRHGICSK